MENSPPESNAFSVRIVSIDYYMAPPITDLDICYSSFQGGKVDEVPVIRIFGSTPAGQKTCLHVHRALPYLYIPCSDISLQTPEEGNKYTWAIASAIEKALKLKNNTGSRRQHVHGCNLVRARKFYGYHPSEELFVKIYLYHPHEVSCAATLILGGTILNRRFQPHESHIPYLLQFLVDYNLYGMGHVHVAKVKFRHPLPDVFIPRSSHPSDQCGHVTEKVADPSIDASLRSPIWISSIIPIGWMWPDPLEYGSSLDQDHRLIKRQSTCELEGDAFVDDILNQQLKLYSSLSQTRSDVKMVQSLIPIWEEEYERTGLHEAAVSPTPGYPLPEDVLKTMSDHELGNAFLNLCREAESPSSQVTPSQEAEKFVQSIRTLTSVGDLVGIGVYADPSCPDGDSLKCQEESTGNACKLSGGSSYKLHRDVLPSECGHQFPELISANEETLTPEMNETSDPKGTDMEALGILRWLASSQAAEDINTDDELVHEPILNPFSRDEVLERAKLDFENESQKECQDIIDSLKLVTDHEKSEKVLCSTDHNHLPETSSENTIPQVDGLCDDPVTDHAGSSLDEKMDNELKRCFSNQVCEDIVLGLRSEQKKAKRLWGSLPFSTQQNVYNDLELPDTNEIYSEGKNGTPSSSSSGNKVPNNCDVPVINSNTDICDSKEGRKLTASSVRDLMRRKRHYRVEPMERGTTRVKRTVAENKCKEETSLYPKRLEFHTEQDGEAAMLTETLSKPLTTDQQVASLDRSLSVIPCSPEDRPDRISKDTSIIPAVNQSLSAMDTVNAGTLASSSYASDSEERDTDGVFPFSVDNCHEEKEVHSKSYLNIDLETLPGVPIHYQNDGSFLYLLKSVISPPSVDSVNEWLSHMSSEHASGDVTGTTRENAHSAMSEVPSVCNSEKTSYEPSNVLSESRNMNPHGTPMDMCYETLPKVGPVSHAESTLDSLRREEHKNLKTDIVHGHETKPHCEGNDTIRKEDSEIWQDVSQISGPDTRTKLTPLSQIGFRDPASVGGGQQLTLLSIEVLAESRGDRRSDPKFDSLNAIALTIQEDSEHAVEACVLLRANAGESCQRSLDAIPDCKVVVVPEEKDLFNHFVKIVKSFDPDILMGWEIQGGSLGFLAERAAHFGIGLLNSISRTPNFEKKTLSKSSETFDKATLDTPISEAIIADPNVLEDSIIDDEWGRTHGSGVHVGGRVVLNIWRLMRGEVKLNMYTIEAVAEAVLRRKIPSIPSKILAQWYSSGPGRARFRCIEYVLERAKMNLEIMNQLDMINRTSELARVFGIDFFSVLSRGSQYRVESMLLRLAHTQNYLAVSPGNQQVASQPAMECLPLVMEPESGFYADPVVVLDFQSLYPSMIIAYNLCFCTCLGKVMPSKAETLGVSSYIPDPRLLMQLKHQIMLTPNGVMYVPSKIRKGVLPRLLEEILSTRIMVKQAMKKLTPSEQVLQRIFNARQLALKLIANVTYGYTAAGFSGRMPCAELADSIVQCGRRTLETAISFVIAQAKWNARVIYGDTDSMFVLLKGRTVKEAFRIGQEIASEITSMNPNPVALKMEKVYHPCFLLTKKRYVGYSYENPGQAKPSFDAKGIETVRRDSCEAVAKTLELSLRLYFEQQDISKVKVYLQRQWKRILGGRVSLQDFVFAKEVRLGTYSTRISSLPPAAIVATKAMRADPRAEPRYGERIPYVVIHGEPGSRLADMVIDPLDLLRLDSPFRLNDLYYINKQIIPALQRVFGLVGADLNKWFLEMPRPVRQTLGKRHSYAPNAQRTRIDFYYLSKNCVLCGELVQASTHLCEKCSKNGAAAATAVIGKTSKLERDIQHLAAICRHCGGGDWIVESGVKCESLACSVFYERRKVQKELQHLSSVATETGYYPKCMVEWF